MNIEEIPISELTHDPNNARLHDDKNIQAIIGSLKRFGQVHPIIIDDKNIVLAGNGRLMAAKHLGWDSIKCVRTDLKSNVDKTAFSLADNRTSELAAWDMNLLGTQLQSLYEDDFDIGEIGFNLEDYQGKEGKDAIGATELSEDDFSTFDHQCPKCGFEFDDK